MRKSVGVKKKSIWRDKASWELLMLCVPTLLAFTLFHYVPMIGIITPGSYRKLNNCSESKENREP